MAQGVGPQKIGQTVQSSDLPKTAQSCQFILFVYQNHAMIGLEVC